MIICTLMYPALMCKQQDLPRSVYVLEDSFPSNTKIQTSMVMKAAEDSAAHLGTKLQTINLVSLWADTCPPEAKGEPLHEYLREVSNGAMTNFCRSMIQLILFRLEPILFSTLSIILRKISESITSISLEEENTSRYRG